MEPHRMWFLKQSLIYHLTIYHLPIYYLPIYRTVNSKLKISLLPQFQDAADALIDAFLADGSVLHSCHNGIEGLGKVTREGT